jgi:hypothetical protein
MGNRATLATGVWEIASGPLLKVRYLGFVVTVRWFVDDVVCDLTQLAAWRHFFVSFRYS